MSAKFASNFMPNMFEFNSSALIGHPVHRWCRDLTYQTTRKKPIPQYNSWKVFFVICKYMRVQCKSSLRMLQGEFFVNSTMIILEQETTKKAKKNRS